MFLEANGALTFFLQAVENRFVLLQALEASLQKLQLDYVDLYLIHSPFVSDDIDLAACWEQVSQNAIMLNGCCRRIPARDCCNGTQH